LTDLTACGYSTNIFVKGCATAIRKSLSHAIFPLPIDSAWAHDAVANDVAMITKTRKLINESLIDHRIHDLNVSGFTAVKPKIRQRLNNLVENFEMSRMPPNLYPILIPEKCTASDLDFLFAAALRAPSESRHETAESLRYVQAMIDLLETRAKVKHLPVLEGLRFTMERSRQGAFRELSGRKILAMEAFRISHRAAFRPRKKRARNDHSDTPESLAP
jgi:hypothetical protein